MDSYHVPSTDPNSLKIDPMVTGEMMETQDPPLVQNGNIILLKIRPKQAFKYLID